MTLEASKNYYFFQDVFMGSWKAEARTQRRVLFGLETQVRLPARALGA